MNGDLVFYGAGKSLAKNNGTALQSRLRYFKTSLNITSLSDFTLEDLIKSIHNSCIFVNMFAMNWNI